MFLLFIVGTSGIVFLVGVDKEARAVEQDSFNETRYTWSQAKVMKYLQNRVESTYFDADCRGVFHNTNRSTILYENATVQASQLHLSSISCSGSTFNWFTRYVEGQCTRSYEEGSALSVNMAACKNMHCIPTLSANRTVGNAGCVYCECRPALVELLHQTSFPLFASGLGFMVFEIGLGLLATSLVFAKRQMGNAESWRHFWLDKEFKKQHINSCFDAVCLTGGCILGYFDILTDIYVAYSFFQTGDFQFAALTCTFLLLPPLILALVSVFFLGAKGEIQSNYWGAFRALTFTELAYQTGMSLWQGERTVDYQHSRIVETAFESVPQSVLQFYILVTRWGKATTEMARQSQRVLFGSALVSMGSISLCCVTFISHGYLSEVDTKHFMFKAVKLHKRVGALLVGLYAFTDITAHVLVWATFGAVNLLCAPSRWWVLCLALIFVTAERAFLIQRYAMVPHRPLLATSALLVMLDYPTGSMRQLPGELEAIAAKDAGTVVHSFAFDAGEDLMMEVPMSEQTHFVADLTDTALLHRQLALSLFDSIWMTVIIFQGRSTLHEELQSSHLLMVFSALWLIKLMAYRVLYVLGDENFGWKTDRECRLTELQGNAEQSKRMGRPGGVRGSGVPRKKDSMESRDNPLFSSGLISKTAQGSSKTVAAMESMKETKEGMKETKEGGTDAITDDMRPSSLTRHVTKHIEVI
jgi:hypothetical protein